jgi:hypothetical protein
MLGTHSQKKKRKKTNTNKIKIKIEAPIISPEQAHDLEEWRF